MAGFLDADSGSDTESDHEQQKLSDCDRHDLFDGDDLLFKKQISTIDTYGEYGVGETTIWAYKNTQVNIISVDTSQAWIEKVKSNIKLSNRVDIDWVDLGEFKWI